MTGKSAKARSTPICARDKCGKALFAPISCDVCTCFCLRPSDTDMSFRPATSSIVLSIDSRRTMAVQLLHQRNRPLRCTRRHCQRHSGRQLFPPLLPTRYLCLRGRLIPRNPRCHLPQVAPLHHLVTSFPRLSGTFTSVGCHQVNTHNALALLQTHRLHRRKCHHVRHHLPLLIRTIIQCPRNPHGIHYHLCHGPFFPLLNVSIFLHCIPSRAKAERESRRKAMMERAKKGVCQSQEPRKLC